MKLDILKSGVLDTIQDNGRHGFAKWGINAGGAMDRYAHTVGNALVGNALNEGVIEMHFPSSEIQFTDETLISITGADFGPTLNGMEAPLWKTIHVPKDSVLSFSKNRKGMRTYLAVHGGFDLPRWLGSLSTNMKATAGGYHGRPIKKGDRLLLKKGKFSFPSINRWTSFPWTANTRAAYEGADIMIVRGSQWEWLTDHSKQDLLSEKIKIDSTSDRMASNLVHKKIDFQHQATLLSAAVTSGTLQAPPSGKLIALMADHQTTGGYPRVAHIISAHLPKFAQLTPGETFKFSLTTIDGAEKMLLSLQAEVNKIQGAVLDKLNAHYVQH